MSELAHRRRRSTAPPSSRWSALRSLAHEPTLRRMELAFALFSIAEHATWIAVLVHAYGRGGVRESGTVAFALLGIAMAAAPLLSAAVGRLRPDRALAAGYLVQSVSMAATAWTMGAGMGRWIVYPIAACAASSITATRPSMTAALPVLAETPADLTAANVATGILENAGIAIGPLFAALLTTWRSPSTVFAVMAALCAVAVVLMAGVVVHERLLAAGGPGPLAWRDALAGLGTLRRDRDVGALVAYLCLGSVVAGAAEMLFVALAAELTSDQGSAGVFNSVFGAGAILGAAGSVVLIGRARLTPFVAAGVLLLCAPVALIGLSTHRLTAFVGFAVSGAGLSLLKVAGANLMQRSTHSDVAAQVFGMLEALQMGAMAAGSLAIGILVDAGGLTMSMLVVGLGTPLVCLVPARRLLAIDRHAVPAAPDVLRRLRGDPVFGPLPAPALERVALDATRVALPAGSAVLREGEPGDAYYVVLSGEVEITIRGEHVRSIGPEGSFGEIALLRDIARTATATTVQDSAFLVLRRDAFLRGLGEHRHARTAAEVIAGDRLQRT